MKCILSNGLIRIASLLLILITFGVQAKSIDERMIQYGKLVDNRLAPKFAAAGVSYPPAKLTFIGLKQERVLQIFAAGTNGQYRFIRAYPILAASGDAGPKLKQGDEQVPEGFYRIESLNPNSMFHLSLRVNYPNEFDRAQAKKEGRRNLGGDIMIHGNAVSIGCLAMGDPASEDLFVLAQRTGLKNIKVILSPVDFRVKAMIKPGPDAPKWLQGLYVDIKTELRKYDIRQVSSMQTEGERKRVKRKVN